MTALGRLLLLGGGGHAAVVAESARDAGWEVTGYLDDDPARTELESLGPKYFGALDDLARALAALGKGTAVHAAVGSGRLRRRWLDDAAVTGAPFPAIVHPSAIVSPSAVLAESVFVGPRAVICARTRVDRGALVNTGAIVEHDVVLGAFCHVAPGSVVAGGANVGADVLVGVGAAVLPGVRLGDGATLGAAAVALDDVPAGVTAVGVPARARVGAGGTD